jgi:uncharacterized protein with HEPN domain
VSAKDPLVRLQHILDQIDRIEAATRGLTYENIIDNFIYERGVERAVQIISEAAKELPGNYAKNIPMFIGARLSESGIS